MTTVDNGTRPVDAHREGVLGCYSKQGRGSLAPSFLRPARER